MVNENNTYKTVKTSLKSILIDNKDNLPLYNELKNFYNELYKKLNYDNKIDGSNLSQVFSYLATDIYTNIENNIRSHFFNYIRQFVNSSFKNLHNEKLNKCKTNKEKKAMKIAQKKELF